MKSIRILRNISVVFGKYNNPLRSYGLLRAREATSRWRLVYIKWHFFVNKLSFQCKNPYRSDRGFCEVVDMLIKSWNQLETWVFEAAGAITSSMEMEKVFENTKYSMR